MSVICVLLNKSNTHHIVSRSSTGSGVDVDVAVGVDAVVKGGIDEQNLPFRRVSLDLSLSLIWSHFLLCLSVFISAVLLESGSTL